MSDDEQKIPYNVVTAEALFDEFEDMLVRFMTKRGLDHATAEDLAQEVWIELFKTWERDLELDSPEKKLFTTARWRVADHFRRSGRNHLDLVADMAASTEHIAGMLMTTPNFDGLFTRRDVVSALQALPSRQREVLMWRFEYQLSIAATAALMALDEHNVKYAQLRALKKLRDSPFLSGHHAKSAQPEVTK